jgi:hypothetical protein
MNAELEALLRALQAVFDARSAAEGKQLNAIFESRLDDAANRIGVSKEILRKALYDRRLAWIKAQQKTSTLPPSA